MDLILWRHADADFSEPDLQRALTAKGRRQARAMAGWLGARLPDSCRILVSPALRALQSAEALERNFKVHPQLAPGAAPEHVLRVANWPTGKEPVLIVGHQPTLGQAAALLLCGQRQDWEVKKATAWWFVQREPNDPSSLYLKAVMGPDLIVN